MTRIIGISNTEHAIVSKDRLRITASLVFMDIELIEIREFLTAHPPFDRLRDDVVTRLLHQITIRYLRRGLPFPPQTETGEFLYLVRQGAIALRDQQEQLLDVLNEGEIYADSCIDPASSTIATATTTEDTLLYQIPCQLINELRNDDTDFDRFFAHTLTERLQQALHSIRGDRISNIARIHCGELIKRAPVTAPATMTIHDAAVLMTEQGVSALLIGEHGDINAIVTDRDLRSRCLAKELSPDTPISTIMSTPLESFPADSSVYEALLTMTRLGLHHLPITDKEHIVGMLTSSDLLHYQSVTTIHLVNAIRRSSNLETLIELSVQLPELQHQLTASGTNGRDQGKAITTVIDALTVRLLKLAESELGSPPVPYTWLVFGSQARMEQTAHTDQDNGLLIDDSYQPEHASYFEALAAYVSNGLDRCGIPLCAGEVMATNSRWRQPLKIWKRYFSEWVEEPEPMALMHLSIFFDLRALHGATEMAEELCDYLISLTRYNTLFLAYLTANALHHRPPLGFFRQLLLIREGEHEDTLDIKQHGIIPVVDLARIHALASGSTHLSSFDRLSSSAINAVLSSESIENLRDVLDLLMTIRARHQSRQIRNGEVPDNFLSPQELSALEQRHLKDAFGIIASVQNTLAQRYQSERFS